MSPTDNCVTSTKKRLNKFLKLKSNKNLITDFKYVQNNGSIDVKNNNLKENNLNNEQNTIKNFNIIFM